jgi:hypothetical protein
MQQFGQARRASVGEPLRKAMPLEEVVVVLKV